MIIDDSLGLSLCAELFIFGLLRMHPVSIVKIGQLNG